MWGLRGRSAATRAATTPFIRTWAPSTTSTPSSPPHATWAWRCPWTWRCNAHRIIRGRASTGSGSPNCPTAPSLTRRTRRRSTRTSIRSTSTTIPQGSTTKCCAWSGTGLTTASRFFRVDNPHTKPPNFWAWLIGQVKATDPDVLFLSEAFTPPARQYGLAKLGFTQSYSYFTWRTAKWELTEFGNDIAGLADFRRPNLFVNTPDILHAMPAAQRPGHVRHPRGAGGDDEPGLGRVFRLRAVRAPRGARGQRGIPGLGEVRTASPRLRRRSSPKADRWSRSSSSSTQFAGYIPRCSSCARFISMA